MERAFTKPVDLAKTLDYFKKIKNPMDLIRIKLGEEYYFAGKEFVDDVQLTFGNAMLYHPPTDGIYRNARLLNCNFKRRWKTMAKK